MKTSLNLAPMKNKLVYILLMIPMLWISSAVTAQVKKKTPHKKVVQKKPAVKKPTDTSKKPVKLPPIKYPEGTRVKLTTDSGVIVLRLYDKTPLHRDNFIKLVKEKYYDSLLFHRVIANFMIQGGDPNSKNAQPGQPLGMGGPGYRIPAEFDTTLFHKKGALAAAREGDQVNPQKESSGSQFYIVQGKKYTDQELTNGIEPRIGRKIPAYQREIYKTVGGTPFLDQNYTVFGETESGLEVIDKIARAIGDGNNRPLQDIRMKMEILTDK
jgi:cyclophilin family peptidyl-prolyl cis-trans isomerase